MNHVVLCEFADLESEHYGHEERRHEREQSGEDEPRAETIDDLRGHLPIPLLLLLAPARTCRWYTL